MIKLYVKYHVTPRKPEWAWIGITRGFPVSGGRRQSEGLYCIVLVWWSCLSMDFWDINNLCVTWEEFLDHVEWTTAVFIYHVWNWTMLSEQTAECSLIMSIFSCAQVELILFSIFEYLKGRWQNHFIWTGLFTSLFLCWRIHVLWMLWMLCTVYGHCLFRNKNIWLGNLKF